MSCERPDTIRALLERGVLIPEPATVAVAREVDPRRIATGVVIHPGCRLRGAHTAIGPGCELGEEGPATIDNCVLGERVALKGGFFSGSVFLDDVSIGSSAHVRPGTLLEEGVALGHAVGLKQTVFLPYVVTGSLVNFCDVLMAGGTGRDDHSEVGSSYVHFNFTPHGDKATASLLGDVPRGVLVDQRPIFLGGQGGLVGPATVAYGSVLPAGLLCREDVREEGCLVLGTPRESWGKRPYRPDRYRDISRRVCLNLAYMGNIRALQEWYRQSRPLIMDRTPAGRECRLSALRVLDAVRSERVKRMQQFADKLTVSLENLPSDKDSRAVRRAREQQQAFLDQWPAMRENLENTLPDYIGAEQRASFLRSWSEVDAQNGYVDAVRRLAPAAKTAATGWLQAVVDNFVGLWRCPDQPIGP